MYGTGNQHSGIWEDSDSEGVVRGHLEVVMLHVMIKVLVTQGRSSYEHFRSWRRVCAQLSCASGSSLPPPR